MKKLILAIIAVILISATMAMALDWHTANQVTVAWDAHPEIATDDVMTYMVYKKQVGGADVFIEETADLQVTVSMTEEGKYYFGVSTKRTTIDDEILESEINWSDVDVPEGSTPNPFGAKYYIRPGPPLNLNIP
jgi:hypothetical protein